MGFTSLLGGDDGVNVRRVKVSKSWRMRGWFHPAL